MAEKKSKKGGLGLIETRGTFTLKGVVSGTMKDSFYKQTITRTGKSFRAINFGVTYAPEKTIYVNLSGFEQDYVYFSPPREEENKERRPTERVAWEDRFDFHKEGYRLIGVNLGLTKTLDKEGNERNDIQMLTQYDASKFVSEHLKDDTSVFIRGNVSYSTYNNRRITRFEPTQISLCQDVDFVSNEGTANFTQTIMFMDIKPSEDKSKFIVSAKNVGYNSIEDCEYVVKNPTIANTFKKHLKPYTSIKVWGDINVEEDKDEVVESTDEWGESNPMDRINSPTVREMVIIGGDQHSIDTEVYSQEIVDEAIVKLKAEKDARDDYGSDSGGDWGSGNLSSTDDDDDDPWVNILN